ncbi:MAG: peptidase M49 [Vicinamibacterales bacterium]
MTSGERVALLEQVDDAAVVQVYADGFASLPLAQKVLAWHLYQAALAGRDIYYDQRYRHGLEMRDVLEALVHHPAGIADATMDEVRRYTKLFWLNCGPYNNLTSRKFVLRLTPEALLAAVAQAAAAGARLPLRAGESLPAMVERLSPCFFDAGFDASVTCKTPPAGQDILQASVNNLYEGVTTADLEGFAERHALNSLLAKRGGQLVEEVYRIGGRYGAAIARIVEHLDAAVAVAPPATAEALRALIRFYTTGETADRERYDIAWVRDQDAMVDTINGFIEVYMDARGVKGAWEALVYYVNPEKTRRIERIAAHAQWFEDHMPWEARFCRPKASGITARAIDVVIETGESGPITPVGINLPNEQSVREQHGSKSVSLANVAAAYERSQHEGLRAEFCWDEGELARSKRWSATAGDLTTDLHEVVGHGSGRMADGITDSPQVLLKEHASATEEARADLVALYFIADPVIVELGLVDAADHAELVRAEYEGYARNAIVQLRRVGDAATIEEDHLRNRQMIVHWLLAQTSAIEERRRDGKTYFVVVDVEAFRAGCGRLLAEVQRIKGTGDYAAAKTLFDTYGIAVRVPLRDEVQARVAPLNVPVYTGFVMPRLEPVQDASGAIVDVAISYPQDLTTQMLEYSAITEATRVGAGLS